MDRKVEKSADPSSPLVTDSGSIYHSMVCCFSSNQFCHLISESLIEFFYLTAPTQASDAIPDLSQNKSLILNSFGDILYDERRNDYLEEDAEDSFDDADDADDFVAGMVLMPNHAMIPAPDQDSLQSPDSVEGTNAERAVSRGLRNSARHSHRLRIASNQHMNSGSVKMQIMSVNQSAVISDAESGDSGPSTSASTALLSGAGAGTTTTAELVFDKSQLSFQQVLMVFITMGFGAFLAALDQNIVVVAYALMDFFRTNQVATQSSFLLDFLCWQIA
jgi:hypothetical protein